MSAKPSSIRSAQTPARLLAAAAVIALAAIAGLFAATDLNWTGYGGGADNSRYFDSKEITKANVAKLALVWTYPYGVAGFHPLIVHNTVYTRGRNGALIALGAKTGKELWIHDEMNGMTTRGLNYWESKDGKSRRLIFSMNDYLQEIDAVIGKSIASFGAGGVIDL